jgi:Tol biopolymer transport system component
MPPQPIRFRPLLAAAVLAALALPAAEAGAVVLPADATTIVSGTPDLLSPLFSPAADSSSGGQAVSRDGRFVVFDSRSDGLATDDDDDVVNVYVKDLLSGAVQLVSRADGEHGEPAHADCFEGAISADGVAVAFVCGGPLDPQRDGNGVEDVYVRNLSTQQTLLASAAASGDAAGDRASSDPAVAHDANRGVFVAFQSRAQNLVAGLPGGDTTQRIYRRRILPVGAGETVLIAPDAAIMAGFLSDAKDPSISDDGANVAFDTDARLAPGDGNSAVDVYVVSDGRAPLLASRASGAAGSIASRPSQHGLISGDGSAVAFTSSEPFAAALDHDTGLDVYRRQLSGTFATDLISVGAGGQKGEGNSFAAAIDTHGDAVAFRSNATNLDAADTAPGSDAYVNRGAGAVLASQGDGSAGPAFNDVNAASLAGDGSKAVLALDDRFLIANGTGGPRRVVVRDLAAATTRSVSPPPDGVPFPFAAGFSAGGVVSSDGRYVAFDSTAPGLGLPPGVVRAVFVRDLETGALTLASRADAIDGAPFGPDPAVGAISGDGRRVSFLVKDEVTHFQQVYVRDLPSGRTFLASRADGPDGAPADAFGGSLSDDGARVAFVSSSANLVAGVNDGRLHAYVRDLATGRTLLVDRADGEQGVVGDLGAREVRISGDGRRVALVSEATNLVAGDANAHADVFVRDLDPPFATRLASATPAGAPSDADAAHVSIDRAGQRVAFETAATTLGATPPGNKLYVRDLGSGTLDVAGRADGPDGAPLADVLGDDDPLLSGDGAHVAFTAGPSASVAPGAPGDGVVRLYERDLRSGTTRLISRLSGPDGAANAGPAAAVLGGITADGGCVAFSLEGRFLPPPASSDFSEVFVRSVIPNCGRPVPPPQPGGSHPALLSRLALRPARFHVGGRRAGTRIHFRLDRSATVSLRVERLLPGRRAHGRCSARAHRGRRCTVVKRVGRLAAVHGRAGANAVRFSGRVGARALAPGRYRLIATPAGGRSRTAGFVVVKAPRRIHHGRKGSR